MNTLETGVATSSFEVVGHKDKHVDQLHVFEEEACAAGMAVVRSSGGKRRFLYPRDFDGAIGKNGTELRGRMEAFFAGTGVAIVDIREQAPKQ